MKREKKNKNNYTLHLATKKHLDNKKGHTKHHSTYNCTQCQKQYNSRNGLWKHAKICVIPINNTAFIPEPHNTSNEFTLLTNLILHVVKSNNELQKQHTELQKLFIDFLYKNNNSTVL